MGNLVFIVLHLLAVVFGFVFLVITIPLHLIYVALKRRPAQESISDQTHVRCPECREPVRRDAVKCRHCGAAIAPQPPPEQPSGWLTLAALIGGLLVLAVLFK